MTSQAASVIVQGKLESRIIRPSWSVVSFLCRLLTRRNRMDAGAETIMMG